jgi:antibiotic biosynthesis monooxygenase
MVRSIVRHRVSDYDAWRAVYDSFADVQKAGGVRAEAVYRAVDDPNDVTVTHDFDDAAAARAFFDAPELRDAMMRAGVQGEPEVWLVAEA